MIGRYPAKLDEKNRLFVPAKLREDLGTDFYVTFGVNCGHRCLTAYTAADWAQLESNFNALPISQRSAASSLIFMYAVRCTPDKQARFSLTGYLMDYAGLSRDVVIVGRAGQAEIWDSAEFDAFEKANLSPEMLLKSLEEIGL